MERESSTAVIPREKHFFTVDEANRSLPLVSRIVRDITIVYRRVLAIREHMDHLRMSGLADEYERQEDLLTEEVERLRQFALELNEIGAQLKDWHMGLVDFPAVHHGREVLLCWRQGERSVQFWHEAGDGFAGRQPIDRLDPRSR